VELSEELKFLVQEIPYLDLEKHTFKVYERCLKLTIILKTLVGHKINEEQTNQLIYMKADL
jgi:hypothetical protein